MFNLNRAMIIGNIVRDPEMRYTPNGKAVTSFSIATNRTWLKDGEPQKETEYHNIVAWTKLAEIANQLFKKGKQAYVDGRIQTRSWEGPDGAKRYRTEIIAENLIVLGPKDYTQSNANPVPAEKVEVPKEEIEKNEPVAKKEEETKEPTKAEPAEEEIDIDDIPF